MDVHSFGEFGVGFAGYHPAGVVEFVAAVVGGDNVHEHDVFGLFGEAVEFDFEGGEHASRDRGGKIMIKNIERMFLKSFPRQNQIRIIDFAIFHRFAKKHLKSIHIRQQLIYKKF